MGAALARPARGASQGRSLPPRICMLFGQDHTTHPIIRRQLGTLSEAGCALTVVDGGDAVAGVAGITYTSVHVRPISLRLLAKTVWRVLRRVSSPSLGEAWWTLIHFLQVFLTAIPYAVLAIRSDADHYQAHDLYSLLPALVAGKLRGRRVIYDAHELVSEQ